MQRLHLRVRIVIRGDVKRRVWEEAKGRLEASGVGVVKSGRVAGEDGKGGQGRGEVVNSNWR